MLLLDPTKPDLIPSPDHNFCTASMLQHNTKPINPTIVNRYQQGLIGQTGSIGLMPASHRSPFSSSLSSSSFSTFRRPILSPAPEILSSSQSSIDCGPVLDQTVGYGNVRHVHKFDTLPYQSESFSPRQQHINNTIGRYPPNSKPSDTAAERQMYALKRNSVR